VSFDISQSPKDVSEHVSKKCSGAITSKCWGFSGWSFWISVHAYQCPGLSALVGASGSPEVVFDLPQHRMILRMFQPGQVVRVNLAGLQAEGVMFQAAVTDAVGHIVKQTSEQPPKYLVKLLFSFRGVSEVEVPAERIHGDK
jgi:hypothetical protein